MRTSFLFLRIVHMNHVVFELALNLLNKDDLLKQSVTLFITAELPLSVNNV